MSLGHSFSVNENGTYSGDEQSIAEGFGDAGYGVYGLTALKRGVYSTTQDNIPKASGVLIWPGTSLDDVTDAWLGCSFKGTSINNKGMEGLGCNRRITRDANGSATKIRVEYQMRDRGENDEYIKCVLVDLTEREDGVYATKVGTGNKNVKTTSAKVGYSFGDVVGGSAYEVYDLFAIPCIKLESDEDWSAYGRMRLGDVVIDLNGRNLTSGELVFDMDRSNVANSKSDVTAQMNFFTFPGNNISNDCINVGSFYIDTTNIRLCIDGYGTYFAAKNQVYTGGTKIVGGVFKPSDPAVLSMSFGATGGIVTVDNGGILDLNGKHDFYEYPPFVLAGGTMQNTGADLTKNSALLKGISLTADSAFSVAASWGLINTSHKEVTLNLDGHKLALEISRDKTMYFTNVRVPSSGMIEAAGLGCLEVRNDKNGIGLEASAVDMRISCELRCHGPVSIRNYVAATTENGKDLGMGELYVYGVFKPMTGYFRGMTMQDGSTLDFSSWPSQWPVASSYTCSGDKTVKFAAGSVVNVKLGSRRGSDKTPIVAWTDETRPENSVKFVRAAGERQYSLSKRSDGLYAYTSMVVVIR